jgi:hypothetical protein
VATSAATRRLAGIAFEAKAPPSADVLPRMDVAGFVGFAASGPVNVPVPVEDSSEFAAIFGGDLPLAWDAVSGESVRAQLAPSVRAFFRNGGRRAWIVRVAGDGARRTLVPVPGLVAARGGRLWSAQLPARSAGSWADGLEVQTALTVRPVAIVSASASRLAFRLEVPSGDEIVAGDLIRVRHEPYELLVVVASVTPAPVAHGSGPDAGRTLVKVVGERRTALWLEAIDTAPVGTKGTARLVGEDGTAHNASVTLTAISREQVELDVSAPLSSAPAIGSLVAVGGLPAALPRQLFLLVDRVQSHGPSSFAIGGTPSWVRRGAPKRLKLREAQAAERLYLELRVRLDDEQWTLHGLGLAPGHPRYVGELPTDEELFDRHEGEVAPPPPPELWRAAATPRFPLAGRDLAAPDVFYPLGVRADYGEALGAAGMPETALARDGLARFDDSLFLDPALRARRVDTLLTTAEYVRWQSPNPRPLTGIHALLGIDEVTIAAVPDAAQTDWKRSRYDLLPKVAASEPPPGPAGARFEDCGWRVLDPAPILRSSAPDAAGSFRLTWTATTEPDARYVLEESADPSDWKTATTLYSGPHTRYDLVARPRGTYAYRVRIESHGNVSAWSDGRLVRVAPPRTWQSRADADYSPRVLLSVQRALLRMCAARGDILGVLSTPLHYREDAAIAHAAALRAGRDPSLLGDTAPAARLDPVEPLDASEARALAHGALYHPWLTGSLPQSPARFARTPPDGAAAGVLAERAATRGAWVAPANVVLRDVVTLTPAVDRRAYGALLQAQVNEVRQEANGFLWLSQDTLADDPDLRPVNVRRLIALLRRLALLRGVDYVFEPNDAVFRRSVQRGFEATLTRLFVLGAFAGATADDAFRVEIGSPPNTRVTLDAGQLIVELKVAPSRPLAFITVRLVGEADSGFRVDAR